jgi:uncharacterized protein YuzE
MKITYDPKADALYIFFTEKPAQVTTKRLDEDFAVDFAPNGEVVGIEVLDASEHVFKKGAARKVLLENLEAA